MPQKPILEKFGDGFISSTSIINEHVKLGKDSKIWNFCNIYGTEHEKVVIGDNTQIGTSSEIKPHVKIGNNCRFQYGLFVPDHVTIGNNVFIGPSVTFTNDKYPSTGKAFDRTFEKLVPTVVKDYVMVGAGVTFCPGITIGRYALIGSGSVVTKDVPDFAVVAGNPAKIIGSIKEEKFKKNYRELKELYGEVQ